MYCARCTSHPKEPSDEGPLGIQNMFVTIPLPLSRNYSVSCILHLS